MRRCTGKASWHGALLGDGLHRNSYKQLHPSEIEALVELHAQPDDSSVPLELLTNKKVGLLTQLHKLLWRFNIVYWRVPEYNLFRIGATVLVVREYCCGSCCNEYTHLHITGLDFWQHVLWSGSRRRKRSAVDQRFGFYVPVGAFCGAPLFFIG